MTILFLPPTLVTGVFGMNTKGLPVTDMDTAFLAYEGLSSRTEEHAEALRVMREKRPPKFQGR
jgi:hypothetical protein